MDTICAAGGRAAFFTAPLDDPSAPAQIVSHTIRTWGRLDALVNNAATMSRGDLETTTFDEFDRTIAINLRSPLFLTQAALPQFRRQGGGRVLNIGSINSYCGERNQLAYSISKGGLMTLTRNLADAYGPEGVV